jgi:hypothetical protein
VPDQRKQMLGSFGTGFSPRECERREDKDVEPVCKRIVLMKD